MRNSASAVANSSPIPNTQHLEPDGSADRADAFDPGCYTPSLKLEGAADVARNALAETLGRQFPTPSVEVSGRKFGESNTGPSA